MKNLLRKLAIEQGKVIVNINERNVAKRLKSVPGAHLDTTGNIQRGDLTAGEYREIEANINNFRKEWRQFAEDTTKVILEKNFAMSVLKSLERYFFFRNIDAKDHVVIKAPKDFLHHARNYDDPSSRLFFIFLSAILSIVLGIFMTPWALVWIPCAIIIFLLTRKYYQKRAVEFLLSVQYQPRSLFGNYISTRVQKQKYAEELRCALKVEIDSFSAWYNTALRYLAILSAKLGGNIVWLFDTVSLDMNSKSYRFTPGREMESDGINSTTNHRIVIASTPRFMVPVIETSYSFIFCFPNWNSHYELNEGDMTYLFERIEGICEIEGEKLFCNFHE